MKVIVDTMNALHTTGVLPPEMAGLDVAGLVAHMARGRWAGNQVLLVCDGNPPPGQRAIKQGGISTVYAGGGREADDLIEELITRSHAPTQLLVVSSDRRIIKAARRRRCHTMGSDAFLRSLKHDQERTDSKLTPRRDQAKPVGRVSRKAAEEWKSRFGLTADDMAEFEAMAQDAVPTPQPEKEPPTPPAPKRAPTDQPFPDELIAEAMRLLEDDPS